ncbi:MAG: hypothetical protein L6R42_004372 [Xanthoria sp. 1 TBL-2021]|nr:MAG: hypothetical protein L6R42_004372 [Xanthoria sp. 1 TBL-2021]
MDTSPSLRFCDRIVRAAALITILIQVNLGAATVTVCLTYPELLADDGNRTFLWINLTAIIDLALVLSLSSLLTWGLLCLYRRHPSWFPYLMALDEVMGAEDMEAEGLEWVTGLERPAVWDEKEKSHKEGGDLV